LQAQLDNGLLLLHFSALQQLTAQIVVDVPLEAAHICAQDKVHCRSTAVGWQLKRLVVVCTRGCLQATSGLHISHDSSARRVLILTFTDQRA